MGTVIVEIHREMVYTIQVPLRLFTNSVSVKQTLIQNYLPDDMLPSDWARRL